MNWKSNKVSYVISRIFSRWIGRMMLISTGCHPTTESSTRHPDKELVMAHWKKQRARSGIKDWSGEGTSLGGLGLELSYELHR